MSSCRIGLIGGTGAARLVPDASITRFDVDTPYGAPSSAITQWRRENTEWLFVARHGDEGRIPPHRVNYRANVWALRQASCDGLIGINAVGGIDAGAVPGRLVFPDQLIDYTWGREHTYADGNQASIPHAEFTSPVAPLWHAELIAAATREQLEFVPRGTYAVAQGPRLETAAEIDRFERDGCNVVGMTAMPEAALARELDLDFAICAVVVNRAAGRAGAGDGIHAQIAANLARGMARAGRLLGAFQAPQSASE